MRPVNVCLIGCRNKQPDPCTQPDSATSAPKSHDLEIFIPSPPCRSWSQGACLSISREPRWQGEGADARRAAQSIVDTMDQPCNAADAPLLANPSGPGRFPLMRRCRLLIGYLPNLVGSALPEGKSAAVAATRNTQTGSSLLPQQRRLLAQRTDAIHA